MPKRASYTTTPQQTVPQTVLAFDEEPAAPPASTVAEHSEPGYSTAPKWIDTAGKTRTWELRDPEGSHVAEITTKRDAEKLAKFLNGITGQSR